MNGSIPSLGSAEQFDIAQPHLRPLPLFTSVSQTERYVDAVAAKIGMTVRVEGRWTTDCGSRELRYQNSRSDIELCVLISRGRTIEGNSRWSMRCMVTDLGTRLTVQAPWRLRPASFEKDARELLANIRRRSRES